VSAASSWTLLGVDTSLNRMEGSAAFKDGDLMAKELKPIAITLDMSLPEIDGWDVITRLKEDDSTRNSPVLVVSVINNSALGRALGAIDYFVKRVDGKALL